METVSIGLIILGSLLVLVAGIGILRMPDIFLRMAATTKAATLGLGTLLIGVAFHFAEGPVVGRLVAIIAFLALTAPVAAHTIGRAAYYRGGLLWEETELDDLEAHIASQPAAEHPSPEELSTEERERLIKNKAQQVGTL